MSTHLTLVEPNSEMHEAFAAAAKMLVTMAKQIDTYDESMHCLESLQKVANNKDADHMQIACTLWPNLADGESRTRVLLSELAELIKTAAAYLTERQNPPKIKVKNFTGMADMGLLFANPNFRDALGAELKKLSPMKQATSPGGPN